ncbi:hypothetical protein TI04_11675 [Achromatium sp. WMS2]|nr:hypothetical protein TI04_11675 [Achromatium sp. WMS2]
MLGMTVNASISIRCATKFPRKNQHDSHGGQNGIEPSASFHNACPALSSFSSINAPPGLLRNERQIRSSVDPKISCIPTIINTSRIGVKHRAISITPSVKHQLGKPYPKAELPNYIYAVLAATEVNAQT